MEQEHRRRLAYIKYLFESGVKQSNQPEPVSAFSILAFHDSVEMFLHLTWEKLGETKEIRGFMNYFDKINEKLKKETEMSQKASMSRLNDLRIDLKHKGRIPSKFEIESMRISTTNFFTENCPTIFGETFENISLIDLISFDITRKLLKEAEENFEKNMIKECEHNIALSFEYLLDEFSNRMPKELKNSQFDFGPRMTFLKSYNIKLQSADEYSQVDSFVDSVTESIEKLQQASKILVMGIDYKQYVAFKTLTPSVHYMGNERKPSFYYPYYDRKEGALTKAQFKFCREFIIESALKMQNFSLDI